MYLILKKMDRFFLAVFLLSVLLLFSSCGDNQEDQNPESQQTAIPVGDTSNDQNITPGVKDPGFENFQKYLGKFPGSS